jgi:DNA polymerase-3 subunit delta'
VSFSSIKDQSIPVRLLRNVIRLHRVPNGLLFWGPEGVGKRYTAMEFAKAVNCEAKLGDACGECLSCRKIEHGNHPDLKIIRPSGKARNNELAAYRPFGGGRRVVIIEQAECMNASSANHFLKTLEEPPSETTFVLLTDAPGRLLPTIRSRCQQVRFGTLGPETIAELLLRERDLPSSVADAIAALSQGQMSRAIDLVDSEKRDVVLSVTERLHGGDDSHLRSQAELIKERVADAPGDAGEEEYGADEREEFKQEKLAAAEALIRRDMMEYMYLFQTWYRDGMVYAATGNAQRLLNRDQVERFEQEARKATEEKLEAIGTAWVYIERNLNMDRVFRDLFLKLAA